MEPNPYTDLTIFQIYFDQASLSRVSSGCTPLFNPHLNKYFENSPILRTLNSITYTELAKTKPDYRIGFLSHRYEDKNNTKIDLHAIHAVDVDMYVMPGCLVRHDVLEQAKVEHGIMFDVMFKAIVKASGVPAEDFNMSVGIYQNGVVAKMKIWKEFKNKYLIPVVKFLERDKLNLEYPVIYNLVHADSNYRGDLSKEKLAAISGGYPYYTMHTFILERLWSLYYHNNKNKLTTNF